ncbi:GntR family transcriptional regulator [Actinotignum sanguinis]|uniref:GntR family transcriptional regulator n=1 Tax=Actinotignum sanguinis TaxID=1445614 RepID=UPI001F49B17C|nr:GntR family transcriptional regulator [Actinotignum sanguinis]MDY5147931.1 GntR family transcriptional regulator [Actinotignum sanguinis]
MAVTGSLLKRRRAALRDDVYSTILDMLLGGVFQPEESLSIDGLARDLDVSPTPVREAMVEMEHTGLVERLARRGYRVAPPISTEQIRKLIDVRKLLELQAVDWAYPHAKRLLPELRRAHAEHEDAWQNLEHEKGHLDLAHIRHYFDADWNFHRVIIRYADNSYLESAVDNLAFQAHRIRQTVGEGSSDGAQATAEHHAILEAFASGAREDALAAMEAHLNGVLRRSISDAE